MEKVAGKDSKASIMAEDIKDLLRQHEAKLKKALNVEQLPTHTITSREYIGFRESFMPKTMGFYEKLCNIAASILKIKIPEEEKKDLEEVIRIAHFQTTPEGIKSLSLIAPLLLLFAGVPVSFLMLDSSYLALFFIFACVGLMLLLQRLPYFYANDWRMKSSNQMVLCIFYIVMYMRHTSNIERAIHFASEHLTPPLALDLKKVLWDVENGYYKNIKDSLEIYLETWRKWNKEFIDSFNLIESSLYEPSEQRRQQVLDKALERILEETAEKMTHYAQELKSPVTTLHMLGVILPILGLVILPMIVGFSDDVRWWHIAIIYNVTLPLIVYFMGRGILSKRPTGYGDTDITEINPELKKYENFSVGGKSVINPAVPATFVFLLLISVALFPVVVHYVVPSFDFSFHGFELIGYKNATTTVIPPPQIGPFGLGASILSLFFPLALGLSLGLYFKARSKNIIQLRENTKKLENEFSDSLFQLSNRLADGIPVELELEKVSAITQDTTTGAFFKIITTNIRKFGMSVEQAIFNKQTGAIMNYPSNIILSSMKVLTQSIKKGPLIAAQAILGVSTYIKEIHRVNERLKDLMSEIISDMKSQIKFLTPCIAGIVIGLTSMITYIIQKLAENIKTYDVTQTGGTTDLLKGLIGGQGLPTYYFQLVVGIYVVQVIYILTVLANGIENGADKLNEQNELGKNLIRSTLIYCIFGFFVMLLFNLIAQGVITKAVGS